MAKNCPICGKSLGLLTAQINVSNGTICRDCWTNAGLGINDLMKAKDYTHEDIKGFSDSGEITQKKEQEKVDIDKFHSTRELKGISFSDGEQALLITKLMRPSLYHYNQILNFELLEDEATVTKGGIGKAVAGGILFGGVGAVVGGVTGSKKTKNVCESLQIKITFKDSLQPVEYIKLLKSTTKKKSLTYKMAMEEAQKIMSALQIAVELANESKAQGKDASQPVVSAADEILKFKELFDAGIITEEEFNAKKKQLLGL